MVADGQQVLGLGVRQLPLLPGVPAELGSQRIAAEQAAQQDICLLYTSPSPRDA